MTAPGRLVGVKRRPLIAQAVVVSVFVGGAAVMIWSGVVRLHREGQIDSGLALLVGAVLALAFVPVFLSFADTQNEGEGEDDDSDEDPDLGWRGRLIRYLGLGLGVAMGYAILRENFTTIVTSAIALGFLILRGVYRTILAKAEREGPIEPSM